MSLEITNNITFSVCVLNNPFFTNEHCNLLQRVVCNWLKDFFFFGMTWFLKNIYIGIIILFCWNEFLGFRYSTYNKSIYKVPIPYIFLQIFRFHFYHRNSLQNIIKFNWQNSLQYPTIQILRSMINVQKAKILQSCNFGNILSVLTRV